MTSIRRWEQNKQMRTDEQAGTPDQALQDAYQIFDKTNPTAVTAAVPAVAATLTTALTGTNNDLVFTAKTVGAAGNNITVAYVDPGGVTATAGVVVTGTAIVVNLGRATSAINTTAANVKTLVDGDTNASALVSVANAGADNGTGLVTALTATHLSGGVTAVLRKSGGEYSGHESFQTHPKTTVHQKDQLRTDSGENPSSSVGDSYQNA